LPVVATSSGQLASLVGAGLIERTGTTPDRLTATITRLIGANSPAEGLRRRGLGFCGAHTRPAESERLVGRWRRKWPTRFGLG
jgi:hypothetical protein